MKVKSIIFLLILICLRFNSIAQLGKFNIGLNARLAFLTHIESYKSEYFNVYYGTPKDLIFTAPLSFRYTSNSIISFRYEIQYRKESFDLIDRYSKNSRIKSNCAYLIHGMNLLFKLNPSNISNTSISFGIYFHYSLSEEYVFNSFSFSSSKFNNLKNSAHLSLNRETNIKNSRISLYREININFPIYVRNNEIPVFYSFEIGFAVGISYNSIRKKS